MRHNKLCLKSHRKKILCVPLITSHMIFKGITELERIETIPYLLSFYLWYHKASEATNLYSFILHLQSHSKSMQLSEIAVINSLLLNSATSFLLLFNEFENFQCRKNVFMHELLFSDIANIFSKTSRFFLV